MNMNESLFRESQEKLGYTVDIQYYTENSGEEAEWVTLGPYRTMGEVLKEIELFLTKGYLCPLRDNYTEVTHINAISINMEVGDSSIAIKSEVYN